MCSNTLLFRISISAPMAAQNPLIFRLKSSSTSVYQDKRLMERSVTYNLETTVLFFNASARFFAPTSPI